MSPPGKKILIVEDDDDLRSMFRLSLAAAGFDVAEASDGIRALQRIDSDPPDALVLDLMLPSIDGVAVREEIASNAHTRDIPVVVITGTTRDLSGLDVAAVLRKPVSLELLIATVRHALAQTSRILG